MTREQLKDGIAKQLSSVILTEDEMLENIMQMADAHLTEQLRIGSVVCSADLRNYFAGLAMQALITKENLKGGMPDYVIIARHAYCAADAMIKEM